METQKTKEAARLFKGVVKQEEPFDPFESVGLDTSIEEFVLQPKPEGTLDLDKLYAENEQIQRIKMSKAEDLEGQTKEEPKEQSRIQKAMNMVSVENMRSLFEVNTDDIIFRLKHAVFPFRDRSLFENKSYDLYAPLWILITMTFTVSIFAAAFHSQNEDVQVDEMTSASLRMIGKCFSLSLFYIVVNPFILFYLMDKIGAYVEYLHLVSVYGYSFAFVPIVELINIIPFGYFNFSVILLGAFIS